MNSTELTKTPSAHPRLDTRQRYIELKLVRQIAVRKRTERFTCSLTGTVKRKDYIGTSTWIDKLKPMVILCPMLVMEEYLAAFFTLVCLFCIHIALADTYRQLWQGYPIPRYTLLTKITVWWYRGEIEDALRHHRDELLSDL